MSEIKVNSIKGVGASTAAITVNNTDGTCTANITNNLSNRNLIINGAMQVAQRGTSFNATNTYPVDRFKVTNVLVDEATTQTQHTLTSSDTGPYQAGFRKSLHIQNGNQTGGAGGSDRITFNTSLEAQNLANSGWDYTSSSSYITLQFWVRSSVAQNFNFYLMTSDGTAQIYSMETGTLSADTWTKITKLIPGNSNITINDDNGTGLVIEWSPFMGTDYTSNSTSNDVWAAAGSYTTRTPDQTSTWYTTNNATFEITGVQLEVGSVATDFEHRSFAQELELCKRYYEQFTPKLLLIGRYSNNYGYPYTQYFYMVEKRAAPTCSHSGTFVSSTGYTGNPNFSDIQKDSVALYGSNQVDAGGIHYCHDNGSALIKYDAEL